MTIIMSDPQPNQSSDGAHRQDHQPSGIRILADFNHDGVVDEPLPLAETEKRFAIVLPIPDIGATERLEDNRWQVAGGIYPLEVGTIKVRLDGPIPENSMLILRTDDESQGSVHLFRRRRIGWEHLGAEGLWRLAWESGNREITLSVVAEPSTRTEGRRARKWIDEFTITAAVATGSGAESTCDCARFRVAPFLLTSALDPVEEVLVIRNVRTAEFVEIFRPVVNLTGARLRIFEFDDGTELDVWMRDTMKAGRICAPSPEGIGQAVAVLSGIRAGHGGIETETLDSNIRRYFIDSGAVVMDPAESRAGTRWVDWYGNLEVSPPVKSRDGREFPYGRILLGRQKDLSMHPDVLAFLEAQRLQWPPLFIDTSWVLIGHVDEVVSFVPAPDRMGFRVLLPSTSLAGSILEKAASGGAADRAVFADCSHETTVAELLEKVAASEENAQIQNILHETRARLREGLGIEDYDFIETPALFENGAAVIPNCVNGLVCNGHAILPDPTGPRINGDDAFEAPVRTALTRLGIKVHFVDVWKAYHTGFGEIHCGTNEIRRIQRPAWWEVAGPRGERKS